MAGDLMSGRGDDFLRKAREAKLKFEALDLDTLVLESYKEAHRKAKAGLQTHILGKIQSLRDLTYSENDFQAKLNDYKKAVSASYQNDASAYIRVFKSVIKLYPDRNSPEFFESLSKTFSQLIKEDSKSYLEKLFFVEKLESHIYKSLRIELIFQYFKKQEKTPQELRTQSYSELISYNFKDILSPKLSEGSDNSEYYTTQINRFIDYYTSNSESLVHLENRFILCSEFIRNLGHLMEFSVELGIHLLEYKEKKDSLPENKVRALHTPISLAIYDIEDKIRILKRFSTNIRLNTSEGHYNTAIALKNHFVLVLGNCVDVLKNWMHIDLEATPLKHQIKELTEELKNSVNMEEISILLGAAKPDKAVNSVSRPNRTDIAYYCYYMNQTNSLQLQHPFPSVKAWKEITKKFQRHYKNPQLIYNEIYSNSEERLKHTRINNIDYVLNTMLTDNISAFNLAKKELKMAQLNR